MFDDSGIKLKEGGDLVHKARAGCAWMGYRTSYIKTGLEDGYCTTRMVSGWWYGNTVKRYHKFSPNIPPKCRRENIFWSSCSSYDNLSDEQSLYKHIYPEGWDNWLPRMPGTFTNDMELNTLSQKGQNRTTCDLAWSCQCMRFSSAPLNQNGSRIFSTSLASLGKS